MSNETDEYWKRKAEAQVDALYGSLSKMAGGGVMWQKRLEAKLDQLTRLIGDMSQNDLPPDTNWTVRGRRMHAPRVNASNWSLLDRHTPSTTSSASSIIEMGQARLASGKPVSPSLRNPLADLPVISTKLLPDLEATLFSGAKVMPKIKETIANVNTTLNKLDLSGESIEPAPDGIAGILDFMNEVKSEVESGLADS